MGKADVVTTKFHEFHDDWWWNFNDLQLGVFMISFELRIVFRWVGKKNTNCSYTPGSTNIALENGAGLSRCILIENDENGHIPAIAMLVYQRVMNLDTDEKDNEMKLMKFYSNIRAKYNNLSRRLKWINNAEVAPDFRTTLEPLDRWVFF